MASRKITDLRPDVASKCLNLIDKCNKLDIDILVTCTYRSEQEQAVLYAQGRTIKGKIVTNAKPGQSLHNKVDSTGKPASQAFDVVLMDNGKCVWDTKDHRWQIIGELGESVGLEWAGRWKTFKEFPHFQVKGDPQ
jgi:peptidoglycan L-alanyl-D-glutamate endopeptidase CwlK